MGKLSLGVLLLFVVFCMTVQAEEVSVRDYVRYGNPCQCDYTVVDEDGEVLFRVRPTYTEIKTEPSDFDRKVKSPPKTFTWKPMELSNPVTTFKERRQ